MVTPVLEKGMQYCVASSLLLGKVLVCDVLVMVSYYEKQVSGMAFTVGKELFARANCLRDAELILTAWLQGQERNYAVRAVLGHLGDCFGVGAVQSANLIRKALALDPDDDDARARLVTKALDLLAHQVEAEGATILRAGGKL